LVFAARQKPLLISSSFLPVLHRTHSPSEFFPLVILPRIPVFHLSLKLRPFLYEALCLASWQSLYGLSRNYFSGSVDFLSLRCGKLCMEPLIPRSPFFGVPSTALFNYLADTLSIVSFKGLFFRRFSLCLSLLFEDVSPRLTPSCEATPLLRPFPRVSRKISHIAFSPMLYLSKKSCPRLPVVETPFLVNGISFSPVQCSPSFAVKKSHLPCPPLFSSFPPP